MMLSSCLLLVFLSVSAQAEVDYKAIAEKLVSQFPVSQDASFNLHIEGNVSLEDKRYEFDATDFVLTGLAKFQFKDLRLGHESGPKDGGPNYHDLEFFVVLGSQTSSVKGVVKYTRTDPEPEDPEKSVTGSVTSTSKEWNYKIIMTIDVVKKTVVQAISAPLAKPYLGFWESNCVGQPVADVCPKINEKINEEKWAIYGAISEYINSEFEKMQF